MLVLQCSVMTSVNFSQTIEMYKGIKYYLDIETTKLHLQVLSYVIPSLAKLRKEGLDGQEKIKSYMCV